MKFVKLLTSVHVGGMLRHPHEGALHLDDAEADRLIDAQAAEDVTDGFPKEAVEGPPERIVEPGVVAPPVADPKPHQSEVDPSPGPSITSAAAKPAASKE